MFRMGPQCDVCDSEELRSRRWLILSGYPDLVMTVVVVNLPPMIMMYLERSWTIVIGWGIYSILCAVCLGVGTWYEKFSSVHGPCYHYTPLRAVRLVVWQFVLYGAAAAYLYNTR